MKKSFFIFFILLLFQNSSSYSSEFKYKVYGLKINFMDVNLNFNDNKIYSLINSRGLIGYFVNFKNIIQTSYDRNKTYYYFNLQKKDREKIYEFKTINGHVNLRGLKLDKGSGYKKITKKDLSNIVDPLTATKELLFSQQNKILCSGERKIYDGDDVYKVKLALLEKNNEKLKELNKKYSIINYCRLAYIAIAGHKLKREKKLNSYFVNVYFAKVDNVIAPVYFESKSKFIDIKMYLSTD
jgi:hypothetical protein